MDHIAQAKRKGNPQASTNVLSRLSFLYTLPLLRKGARKDLDEDDVYEVMKDYGSKRLGDKLEDEWEKQKKTRKQPSILRLLWTCFGWYYLMLGVMQLIVNTSVILIQPWALKNFISYFNADQTHLTKQDAIYYAGIMVGINVFNCLYVHNYHLLVTGLGIRIKTGFSSFIYRKALKLSPTRLGDISIGRIVTLMTKDVHSFEVFVNHANDLWIAIVKSMVVCYLIYQSMGRSAIVGMAFLGLVLPVQIFLGKLSSGLRLSMCKRTDQRLQITQETLSAIKIIKMYTWELFFNKKIESARQREIVGMHRIFYLKFIILQIGELTAKIAFYLLLMAYIWYGNLMTAELVYYVQNCFDILRHTLTVQFPFGVAQTAEMVASVKRLGNVLKAMEVGYPGHSDDLTIKPRIVFKDASVNFKDKPILHSINLNMELGITLITGPVGSGKSFLLKTILHDYEPHQGGVVSHGRISYASQEPWLFPSSIKQNILFGASYNEARYKEVLKVCALQYDFDLLSAGDSTIVEDKGINLSKGQQARINLARAVYKESEIYLLDDCLAALDAHVSDFIFIECIKKFLGNKLVVLVTHGVNHLHEVDNVVVLEHGRVIQSGKPSEISESEIILKSEDNSVKKPAKVEKEEEEDAAEDTKLITETTKERKIYQEAKQTGGVSFDVYKKYFKFGGGFCGVFAIIALFICAQFSDSYSNKLVSQWVKLEPSISSYRHHIAQGANSTLLRSFTTSGINQTTYSYTTPHSFSETSFIMSTTQEAINFTTPITKQTDKVLEKLLYNRRRVLKQYTLFTLCSVLLSLLRAFGLLLVARKASLNLHNHMIRRIVNATMHFYDNNFIGNILNRFSKDLSTMDEHLPFVLYSVLRITLLMAGVSILITSVNVTFLIPASITLVLLISINRYYLPTGRSLKRLDAITRSPVIGHLNASLEGLTTIRAFKAEQILKDEFDRHQDHYVSATYMFQTSMRAFTFFLDSLCAFLSSIIIGRFVVVDRDTSAADVGLALSQATHMTVSFQWGVREWAEVENSMTSVERVLEYTEVKQEPQQGIAPTNWPNKGEVTYNKVFLSYNNTNEYVLKDVSFVANPREKIGIVGRTGAGKSSIISSLFRLYEVEGIVAIDGIDTKTVSLEFLRKHISIIPQDPVLFAGTIRDNVDPRMEYSDDQIWTALEAAHLKSLIPSLTYEISENGSNFSVGQRQLICLARAAARNNKIIVLDEATANMDPQTDALIQTTILENFADCTVFTIAHKLKTVLHSDKIIVMDKGQVIEYDEPAKLLKNHEGIFYKMVEKSGLLFAER